MIKREKKKEEPPVRYIAFRLSARELCFLSRRSPRAAFLRIDSSWITDLTVRHTPLFQYGLTNYHGSRVHFAEGGRRGEVGEGGIEGVNITRGTRDVHLRGPKRVVYIRSAAHGETIHQFEVLSEHLERR